MLSNRAILSGSITMEKAIKNRVSSHLASLSDPVSNLDDFSAWRRVTRRMFVWSGDDAKMATLLNAYGAFRIG